MTFKNTASILTYVFFSLQSAVANELLESVSDGNELNIVLETGVYINQELCSETIAQGEDTIYMKDESDCPYPNRLTEFKKSLSEPEIFVYLKSNSTRIALQPVNSTAFLAKVQTPVSSEIWKTTKQFLFTKR